jgi:hypothetical protein
MLAFREKNPTLRVVSASSENLASESIALDTEIAEPIRIDDAILPFQKKRGHRPAA